MRNQFKVATRFLAIIAMVLLYTSCDDEKEDPNTPGGGTQPGTNITVIDEDIDSYTVLENHLTGVDYEICGGIDVNAELVIEPGVEIVMCAGAGVSIEINGSLNAVGTEDLPIVIRGKTPAPGFWDVLHFNSNNPNNELNHVVVTDGGGSDYFNNASIFVNDNNSGQLTLKNSTIKNSKERGISVEDGASIPNFSKNIFSNNGGAPLQIPISIIGAIDDSSNYADGNGENYVNVYYGTVNQNQEVKNINVPYFVEGGSDIASDFKLNPGVELIMGAGASLNVEVDGSINAIGTDSNPIVIKGKVNSVGYWDQIHINSNNPLNEFEFVTIKNGGGEDYFNYSSVWVNDNNNGSFVMTNCTISDSYSWGLYVEDGSNMTPSSAEAVESTNTFSNNGTGVNASCTGDCNVYFE